MCRGLTRKSKWCLSGTAGWHMKRTPTESIPARFEDLQVLKTRKELVWVGLGLGWAGLGGWVGSRLGRDFLLFFVCVLLCLLFCDSSCCLVLSLCCVALVCLCIVLSCVEVFAFVSCCVVSGKRIGVNALWYTDGM